MNPTAKGLLIGAAVVGGVYAVGKLVSYPIPSPRFPGRPDGNPVLANLRNAVPLMAGRQAAVNFQDQLQRYANSPHAYRPLAAKPPTARAIPIVPCTNVQVVPGFANPGIGRDGTVACLRVIREALTAAGRGDEDPRVVLYRLAEETGWFRYCQGFNAGNHKAPGVYASSETILGTPPTVYEAHYDSAVSIHLLTDHAATHGNGIPGPSFDAYYNFTDLATYLRFQVEWYNRNGYVGVQDAYRRGDLQGLIDSEAVLARHGYSTWAQSWHDEATQRNTTVAEIAVFHHTAICQGYWRIRQGIAGAAWIR